MDFDRSVYRQLLPYCDQIYVTKVHTNPESDTFFPDLDQSEDWILTEILESGEENGIPYEMCLYKRNVTKVHTNPESDTFFPDLDQSEDWILTEILESGEENGIPYEMCLYKRT